MSRGKFKVGRRSERVVYIRWAAAAVRLINAFRHTSCG